MSPAALAMGARLRSVREEHGLTAKALALRIGAGSGRISLIETGGCKFTMHWLERIAAGLGLTAAALLERLEDGEQSAGDAVHHRRAANLRRARCDAGMSPQEMADRCGFPLSFVVDMETGRKAITLRTIDRVAAVLGWRSWDFLRELDDDADRDLQRVPIRGGAPPAERRS